eukprot:gnl/TRDRNA2_/TRDRNA2_150685_c0_seq2.p1 gnl/TRDRNA2_/TRDRNA2_150685_c0~~gnl/TRDRNA2_/TRDRNA2_150685_c0_seq2.p1  ORF type:complete len:326 (+),score=93.22 gnl/TRDRNA2_/TRDRNA2_150685_c0_seq2:80-979(+)
MKVAAAADAKSASSWEVSASTRRRLQVRAAAQEQLDLSLRTCDAQRLRIAIQAAEEAGIDSEKVHNASQVLRELEAQDEKLESSTTAERSVELAGGATASGTTRASADVCRENIVGVAGPPTFAMDKPTTGDAFQVSAHEAGADLKGSVPSVCVLQLEELHSSPFPQADVEDADVRSSSRMKEEKRLKALLDLQNAVDACDADKLRCAIEAAENAGLHGGDLAPATNLLSKLDMQARSIAEDSLQRALDAHDIEALRRAIDAAQEAGVDQKKIATAMSERRRLQRAAASVGGRRLRGNG